MKALILSTEFVKEYESKFGTLYLHKIKYDEKTAFYNSKKKEQTYFIPNKEAEFTEELKTTHVQVQQQLYFPNRKKYPQLFVQRFVLAYY